MLPLIVRRSEAVRAFPADRGMLPGDSRPTIVGRTKVMMLLPIPKLVYKKCEERAIVDFNFLTVLRFL